MPREGQLKARLPSATSACRRSEAGLQRVKESDLIARCCQKYGRLRPEVRARPSLNPARCRRLTLYHAAPLRSFKSDPVCIQQRNVLRCFTLVRLC